MTNRPARRGRSRNLQPSPKDIERLVAFLPRLYAQREGPIVTWHDRTEVSPGVLTLPWPEYGPAVMQFMKEASRECWSDRAYGDKDVPSMLSSKGFIAHAWIREIRTILTFCIRGERFCDGHIAGVIEDGIVKQLLERLKQIGSVKTSPGSRGAGT